MNSLNNIINDNLYLHACRNFMTRRDVVLAEGLRTWAVYLHAYPLHPQWDIRLQQQCSSTWFCPLLRPEPRPTRAPYLVALPLLSFAMLSLVVLAARLLVEFHVRYFIGPEYPADLSRTSIVEGCVPFNHSPAPILWWILSKAFLKTMNLIYSEQFHSMLYDVSQREDLISASSSLPEFNLFLPQLLVNSCLDSSKKDSTEKYAVDG